MAEPISFLSLPFDIKMLLCRKYFSLYDKVNGLDAISEYKEVLAYEHAWTLKEKIFLHLTSLIKYGWFLGLNNEPYYVFIDAKNMSICYRHFECLKLGRDPGDIYLPIECLNIGEMRKSVKYKFSENLLMADYHREILLPEQIIPIDEDMKYYELVYDNIVINHKLKLLYHNCKKYVFDKPFILNYDTEDKAHMVVKPYYGYGIIVECIDINCDECDWGEQYVFPNDPLFTEDYEYNYCILDKDNINKLSFYH